MLLQLLPRALPQNAEHVKRSMSTAHLCRVVSYGTRDRLLAIAQSLLRGALWNVGGDGGEASLQNSLTLPLL